MDSGLNALAPTLLHAARAGDRDSFGQLLERYRNYLELLARIQIGRRLQGKVDPSDLVQDTFLEAHRSFERFHGDAEPVLRTWLHQILAGQLAHLVRRYCQTQGRDVHLEQALLQELDHSSDVLDRGLADTRASPVDAAVRREQAVVLADALSELPEDYRDVIILRQIEGLGFVEVAQRMGRSVDSVQKIWIRALDRLRQRLERLN
jgi:RNA polymerase sigma-70 factor (ECF subfamily)